MVLSVSVLCGAIAEVAGLVDGFYAWGVVLYVYAEEMQARARQENIYTTATEPDRTTPIHPVREAHSRLWLGLPFAVRHGEYPSRERSSTAIHPH